MTTHPLLDEAHRDLVRSVDTITDVDLDGPSELPGWSRASVVAHLALNAEGLARALRGVRQGVRIDQYDSDEARDRDIEVLASETPAQLRARSLASVTLLSDALAAMEPEDAEVRLHRNPGGPTFPVGAVEDKRLVEVAFHQVDLAIGLDRSHWSPEVVARLLEVLAPRLRLVAPVRIRTVDVDGSWSQPQDGPVVSGTSADLAWWLSGRGQGEGLTADQGEVPLLPPW